MIKFKLETNNSKKLIIVISILFCTVILITGTTLAFFNQSRSSNLDSIVSNNELTLKYEDDTTYMRNNIIPVVESDVVKFAMKNSLNVYNNDEICTYKDGMNACSLYQFTITNTMNVAQSIKISVSPILNGYQNLHLILYEEEQEKITEQSKIIKDITHVEELNTIDFNEDDIILKAKESKTYTIIFYIKSTDYDQKETDAGKNFAATINVNSITTGTYISKQLGEGCYDTTPVGDGTYKLTKFKGIQDNGEVVEGCRVTKDGDYYTVTVPSLYGGQRISTLGNSLFYPADLDSFNPNDMSTLKINKNMYIKEFTINEGITTIEDGGSFDAGQLGEFVLGTFVASGIDILSFLTNNLNLPIIEEGVTFNLPNSLNYIGDVSFFNSNINEIIIPIDVKIIGKNVFASSNIKSVVIPANVESIGRGAFYNSALENVEFITRNDGDSSLKEIGVGAFNNTKLSSLYIPKSVITIGDCAFCNNSNLETLKFEGALDGSSKLQTIGEYAFFSTNITTLTIPKSVTSIGESTFSNNSNLETLKFEGAADGSSKLQTIGDSAFYSNNISTLTIPNSVTTIGNSAFYNNKNLTTLTFEGTSDGSSKLQTIGNSAFSENGLTYEDRNNPLIIPVNVTSIGFNAFYNWTSYNSFKFIKYTGTNTDILSNVNTWYNSSYTTLITADDE